MIFVTSDRDRGQLEELTRQLVAAFPGSTIYQHINPNRIAGDVLHRKVSGIFLAAEMDRVSGIDLMRMLRTHRPDIPVFILSRTEELRERAMQAGAAGYFLHPVSKQTLKHAVLSAAQGGSGP